MPSFAGQMNHFASFAASFAGSFADCGFARFAVGSAMAMAIGQDCSWFVAEIVVFAAARSP